MTKPHRPLFALNVRGTLASALTFRRSRQDVIAEKVPTHPDAKTLEQLSWRTMYQQCTALWHTLSPAQQAQWERDARRHHLTGYSYYMSLCLKPNPGIYLPLAGGTMQGAIHLDNNQLTNRAPASYDPAIHDADNDTSVETERTPDNDIAHIKTAGTDRLTIHPDGILDLHSQSAFKGYLPAPDQTLSHNTWTQVQLSAQSYDKQAEFNTSTYRFTAKRTGTYLLSAKVTFLSNAVGRRGIRYRLNGATNYTLYQDCVTFPPHIAYLMLLFALTAADYLDLYAYQASGGNEDVNSGANATFMEGVKLA